MIAPVNDGHGDLDFENGDGPEKAAEIESEWGKLANKYEELEDKVNEYLNEGQNLGMRKPPITSAPPKMTKEEWEKHQATHTPYMAGCKHCAVARAARQRHPKKRKHMVMIPDVDGESVGRATVTMDYMYLNERAKGEQYMPNNPPHLVVVDHRQGRV